jgi:putative ABC transport system permease protein
MIDELRLAVKSLARTPAFSLTVIATLALGIGANTAIFSLVHGVLLKPLPFAEPDRLVSVTATRHSDGVSLPAKQSERALDQWRSTSRTLERFAIHRTADYTITGVGEPEFAQVGLVSEEFFTTLGTAPLVGRTLESNDADQTVAVLSYAFWRKRFAGRDPLGSTLMLDGRPYTVAGVMPPAFAFPSRNEVLWVQRRSVPGEASTPGFRAYGMLSRLKHGATLDEARAEAAVISRQLEAWDKFSKGVGASVVRLDEQIVGDVRNGLLLLLSVVGVVLLVACVNVQSLFLARTAARRAELAIRSALGASRARLMRYLLAESLVLVAAGTAAAALLAAWALPAAVSTLAPETPRLAEVAINLPVLAFTMAVSVVSLLVAGLLPAWHASRVPPRDALPSDAGGVGQTSRTGRLRAVLVASQAALSVVVLVAAVLFARSLGSLLQVESDYAGGNVLTMSLTLPSPAYATCVGDVGCERRQSAFGRDVLARVGRIGGVRSAAVTTSLPPHLTEMSFTWPIKNPETGIFEAYSYNVGVVGGDYFRTLGIACVRGRVFDERDTRGSEAVFVAGRDFARRRFGSEDVIGRQLPFGPPDAKGMPTPSTLIGVVDDVRYSGLDRPAGGGVYFPFAQKPYATFYLAVRTAASPWSIAGQVRDAVHGVDPQVPLGQARTLDQVRHASVAAPESRALILGGLAALALALVSVGLYGQSRYVTSQRSFEVGVRMALGANRLAIVRMLVGDGLVPVVLGIAAGLSAAVALSRSVASLLFGVRATDPLTYAVATAVLLLVATCAIAAPARRAARADPALTLKSGGRC